MINIKSRKAEAVALIAVGMLFAFLLFFVLNSEATLLLILGILFGLLFAFLLFFTVKKYTAYTNENTQSQNETSSAIRSKVLAFLGIENNPENSDNVQLYIDKSVGLIKLLFSSMTIFSVFALCISIAIYYSSVMQIEKISEQNKLLCSQNSLAEASNKVALYSIQSQKIELSLKLLRENVNVFSQSNRKLKTCRNHTKSMDGEFIFSSDEFYDCVEKDFNVLENVLLHYQANEAGAYLSSEYMTSTSQDSDFNDLQNLYDQIWNISNDKNYKTFDILLDPFLSYMKALEALTKVSNSQISELTNARLKMVKDLHVSNSHCESITE